MKQVGYLPNWTDRLHLSSLARALRVTLRNFCSRKVTVRYPEEPPPVRYWGLPRLLRDEQGRIKCVACYLCSSGCPARCIQVEAAEAPWEDREKFPVRFEIDALRCIFCGYCVLACPVEAIVMGKRVPLVAGGRKEFIFDEERLLAG